MKKVILLLAFLSFVSICSNAQTIKDIDYVSPFYEGYAAIKKGDQWAFIDKKGDIVVNFRGDLVITKSKDGSYPVFKSGRCLISTKKEGIKYFGYIDTKGNTVIKPEYLNADNFVKNRAIALKLLREDLGKNDVLGKNVINYRYYEVIINSKGEVISYLNEKGTNVTLDKEYLRKPPKIKYQIISDNLVVYKNEDDTHSIKTIE